MRTMRGDVSDETYSAQTKVRSPQNFRINSRRNLLTNLVTLLSTSRNPFQCSLCYDAALVRPLPNLEPTAADGLYLESTMSARAHNEWGRQR